MILLSILIPTVPRRVSNSFIELIQEIKVQIGSRNDIEVIALYDNKQRSIGTKRNNLLQLVQGDYFVFIDDDDIIASNYLELVTKSLIENPSLDLLTYDILNTHPYRPAIHCHYSLEYEKQQFKGLEYYGPPAHTHVWRTELVKSIPFPDKGYYEDIEWTHVAREKVKTTFNIAEELYIYRSDPNTSETIPNFQPPTIQP